MLSTKSEDDTLYNIKQWGDGYFNINSKGNIELSGSPGSAGVELLAIVDAAQKKGLQLPLLIRCQNILHQRAQQIYEVFAKAKEQIDYKGNYQLVYPIKVNQKQSVVSELLKNNLGLEAGSKPELMAILGVLDKPGVILCNGYKDRSYIRLALIAQQMGHTVYIVIEKQSEMELILSESTNLQIRPNLGIRIRLMSMSAGMWANTGGVKSKFGLNAKQVLDVIALLKAHAMLDCLKLMHCHLGSQIANIQDIHQCMQEMVRYYVELRILEAPVTIIDVGGGLGVDYEGTHTNTLCSMNYTLNQYATTILSALKQFCIEARVPEPDIISESGRALTAHHAVLVANITDIEIVKKLSIPEVLNGAQVLRDIFTTYQAIGDSSPQEVYVQAEHSLNEAHTLFKQGALSLEEKVKVETIHTLICLDLKERLEKDHTEELLLLTLINERTATKVFCNMSFFQSIPDSWAVGQIFPIAPLSQLNTAPTMHSILQDLTCDSDGTIKWYTGKNHINSTLMLPPYEASNPYNLGFFLVGAYQEILGNLHNLFGPTNTIEVSILDSGQFEIKDLIAGSPITDVLGMAHFDVKKLLQSYEKQLSQAQLSQEVSSSYLKELNSILSQLTYLNEAH